MQNMAQIERGERVDDKDIVEPVYLPVEVVGQHNRDLKHRQQEQPYLGLVKFFVRHIVPLDISRDADVESDRLKCHYNHKSNGYDKLICGPIVRFPGVGVDLIEQVGLYPQIYLHGPVLHYYYIL